MKLSDIYLLFFLLIDQIKANVPRKIRVSENLPEQNSVQKIPKVFHQIWFDYGKGDVVLPKYVKNTNLIRNLHPDWDYKLWKIDEIRDLISKYFPEFLRTFDSYDKPVKKHDAARIVILHSFGGVYLDHDYICLKNIEPLLKSYDVVLANEQKNGLIIANSFIASIPEHELLKLYIKNMNAPGAANKYVLSATGPFIFTKTAIDYINIKGQEGIKIYIDEYLAPLSWKEVSILKSEKYEDLKKKYPNSYLIQEFDGMWK